MDIKLYSNEREAMEEIPGPAMEEVTDMQLTEQRQIELCIGDICLMLSTGRNTYTRVEVYGVINTLLDRHSDLKPDIPDDVV